MATLHTLDNLNTEVGNLGITIRNGSKWFNDKHETLDLCVCGKDGLDHQIVGHGKVEFKEEYQFRNIPARYLEFEHCEDSRTYSGLFKAMKRAYGDDFSEDSIVTVMGYLRID